MRHFKNILLYTGTEENTAAINRAIKLAKENEARLTLMDVIKPMPAALGITDDTAKTEEVEQIVANDHHQRLSELAKQYSTAGINIRTVVSSGDPAVEIVRRVLQDQHDLVIKTADGLSNVGRLFGSVARSLMRLCPCPVWVLKPEIHGDFDDILAAIDLEDGDQKHSALNREILSLASSMARQENARLHIVCAWDVWLESSLRRRAGDEEVDAMIQAKKRNITKAMRNLLATANIDQTDAMIHLHRGLPTSVLPLVVEKTQADLVVMGTVCRTGVSGFLIGNTAESILTDLTCSVLTLKPEGFRSPVEMTSEPPVSIDPWKIPQSLV